MHCHHRHKLEHDLALEVLAQVQRSINDDKDELQQQHDQKGDWYLVLLHVGRNATVALGGLEKITKLRKRLYIGPPLYM